LPAPKFSVDDAKEDDPADVMPFAKEPHWLLDVKAACEPTVMDRARIGMPNVDAKLDPSGIVIVSSPCSDDVNAPGWE